ncbi:hypothetical protein BT93_G2222 [Corymbia citriodora subsp. variegata]|nr:hypothetical protein BT93_G2222 [Corymbia citriodora subsp. variegata]
MASSGNRESDGDRRIRPDRDDGLDGSSPVDAPSVEPGPSSWVSRGASEEIGMAERLADAFAGEGDGDLLMQRSDREDRVLQWLQALDMQVMGACRADERLKPLLKSSGPSSAAEDRLLAHLSQHFEPAEVGILARCFCMPLVSIRVGKIEKQGTLLCPTSTRGNFNLSLLPTSDMRLSFVGDNGQTERLVTLSSSTESSSIVIEEISGDTSGRSFVLKALDGKAFYFWCSEKSKLLGIELLRKMRDLLDQRPTIAELTGIDGSRLECFAIHLRAYLMGSVVSKSQASSSGMPILSDGIGNDVPIASENMQSFTSSKSLRPHYASSQVAKANTCHQGLSPRASSFKEGLAKSLTTRSTREKLRKLGENHFAAVDNLSAALPIVADTFNSSSCSIFQAQDSLESNSLTPANVLESLGKLTFPPCLSTSSQVPSLCQPIFSPYYCLCPPGASALELPDPPPKLASASDGYTVPSLSSLLPPVPSSLLMATTPLNLEDLPPLDFPTILPDPLACLPKPSSQQIPTFTPLMCDPIVHIPVIDFCSAGQGYLVSAGPTVTTAIGPLNPKLVSPLIPETSSVVEEGARETLRLLINGSSPTITQSIGMFPVVLSSADEKQSAVVAGSRGLYSGIMDVDAFSSRSLATMGVDAFSSRSLATMGLFSLSGRSAVETLVKSCDVVGGLDDQLKGSSSSGESNADVSDSLPENAGKMD